MVKQPCNGDTSMAPGRADTPPNLTLMRWSDVPSAPPVPPTPIKEAEPDFHVRPNSLAKAREIHTVKSAPVSANTVLGMITLDWFGANRLKDVAGSV